jgi:hypothetical protein
MVRERNAPDIPSYRIDLIKQRKKLHEPQKQIFKKNYKLNYVFFFFSKSM